MIYKTLQVLKVLKCLLRTFLKSHFLIDGVLMNNLFKLGAIPVALSFVWTPFTTLASEVPSDSKKFEVVDLQAEDTPLEGTISLPIVFTAPEVSGRTWNVSYADLNGAVILEKQEGPFSPVFHFSDLKTPIKMTLHQGVDLKIGFANDVDEAGFIRVKGQRGVPFSLTFNDDALTDHLYKVSPKPNTGDKVSAGTGENEFKWLSFANVSSMNVESKGTHHFELGNVGKFKLIDFYSPLKIGSDDDSAGVEWSRKIEIGKISVVRNGSQIPDDDNAYNIYESDDAQLSLQPLDGHGLNISFGSVDISSDGVEPKDRYQAFYYGFGNYKNDLKNNSLTFTVNDFFEKSGLSRFPHQCGFFRTSVD